MDVLLCLQINLQKSIAASSELNKRDNPVVFITEPRVSFNKVAGLKRPHTQVLEHGGQHHPRAAIRADKALRPWLVSEFSDQDQCVAEVNIEGKRAWLCSLYLDIKFSVSRPLFLELVSSCQRNGMPLIIGMDSNSHSGLWGCSEGNGRGEELEELILMNSLRVMNVGDVPTFRTSRAKSIIDVTLMNASAERRLNLSGWEVQEAPSFSDHKYIQFSLGKYVPGVNTFRNLKKANWLVFEEAMEEGFLPMIDEDGSNLDECADALERVITHALDKACPAKAALHREPNSWWTAELDAVRQELGELANKRRTQEEWDSYRNLKKVYGRLIRKAKRSSWRDFCSKAEKAGDISKIIKIMRPKPTVGMSLFKRQGTTLSPRETLSNLMDTHFLESTEIDEDEMEEAVPLDVSDEHTEAIGNFITNNKVVRSLMSFGPTKAAGPDGLKPLVLQKLTPRLTEYITEIYKVSVLKGCAPMVWRKMLVIFLPKEGKSDYGVAKSYRPITLSNFLLKGLERILQWYIKDTILKEPLYAQYAYTEGRSCDTAISEAVNLIEKGLYRRSHVLAVSLDCSGAFDRIKFDSASKAMSDNQIPINIRVWYENVLKQRLVTAEMQGMKMSRKPNRGSPQGGVLSPLIWNLIMNEALVSFKGDAVQVFGYADDILLMVTGKDPGVLVDHMNGALSKVLHWGERNGLLFNPTKTNAVRFTRAKKFSPAWNRLKMDGKRLEYSDSMKYLGITLHRQLTWGAHLHDRVNKGVKTLNLANAAIGQKWGLNPERALWVYTAMVRPVVTYGSVVWSPKITTTMKSRLDRLQKKALRCMTSSMRSTPIAGMEVVLGVPPLDLHAFSLGTRARLNNRNSDRNVWDGIGETGYGHRLSHDNILATVCPKDLPLDCITRQRVWVEQDEVVEPDITLYTDGSKMESGTGYGWAACSGDTSVAEESMYLGKKASVFQAEVTAIEAAVRWCVTNCDKDTEVLIRSDSQSAIQALHNPATRSAIVQACQQVLRQAKENLRIAIKWVRGHADNTGNELADSLAKEGSNMNPDTVGPELPIPMSEIKRSLKDHFVAKWQERWGRSRDCRQTKNFFPTVSGTKSKKLAKWPKSILNLLVQAGTGHALVAYHISQWTDVEKRCKLCQEGEESTGHLFWDCPVLERQRREVEAMVSTTEERLVVFFSGTTVANLFSDRSEDCGERISSQIN